MATEYLRGQESKPSVPDSEDILCWLRPCIESARRRGEERLVALLEIVESEIIFETVLTGQQNGCSAEPFDANSRRNPGGAEQSLSRLVAEHEIPEQGKR